MPNENNEVSEEDLSWTKGYLHYLLYKDKKQRQVRLFQSKLSDFAELLRK